MCLDRDGVLNELVIDAEQGTIDSPLHPSQVRLIPHVPQTLARLNALGFACVIVSNQPAAAKRKTTRANLEAVHAEIVRLAQSAGGRVERSYICFHKEEDACACRKPKTGLLEQAFADYPESSRADSWIVGDGLTDIQAGQRFGLQTAFVAAHKCDVCQTVRNAADAPTLWVKNLEAFAREIST